MIYQKKKWMKRKKKKTNKDYTLISAHFQAPPSKSDQDDILFTCLFLCFEFISSSRFRLETTFSELGKVNGNFRGWSLCVCRIYSFPARRWRRFWPLPPVLKKREREVTNYLLLKKKKKVEEKKITKIRYKIILREKQRESKREREKKW